MNKIKYTSINELLNFEFHDAKINKIRFYEQNMTWKVSYINVTAKNTQNNYDVDMCIEEANMIFEKFDIESIVFDSKKCYNNDNELIEERPCKILNTEKYNNILQEFIAIDCCIYDAEILSNTQNHYKVRFYIGGDKENMFLTINFSKSIIEWNKFNERAWYVDKDI